MIPSNICLVLGRQKDLVLVITYSPISSLSTKNWIEVEMKYTGETARAFKLVRRGMESLAVSKMLAKQNNRAPPVCSEGLIS